MQIRRLTMLVAAGAALIAAACASPTAPRGDCDPVTVGWGHCAAR